MLDDRAAILSELIRLRRQLGLVKKPRRRLPRQIVPTTIEREYARGILGVIEVASSAMSPVVVALSSLIASAARERNDANEPATLREMVAEAHNTFDSAVTTPALVALALRFAQRTSDFQRQQLARQVQSAIGTNVLMSDTNVPAIIESFIAENVALIHDIPTKMMADFEKAALYALSTTQLQAISWPNIVDKAKRRARTIAADQIELLFGQLNRTRQLDLGIEHYIWRTRRDNRVRPDHIAREGKKFSWLKSPTDGHPGYAHRCRCVAEVLVRQ